jgi:hypothetical protein
MHPEVSEVIKHLVFHLPFFTFMVHVPFKASPNIPDMSMPDLSNKINLHHLNNII